ncbi:MAG: ArsR family transcriptional regulator [Deltaproteobacteria bacterium]|nr:ArsR family transcriptional regulator [Deltaproteobacteria bacterium]
MSVAPPRSGCTAAPRTASQPRRRALTTRQRILQLLKEGDRTARDLSRILGIREREVYEHLPHVEKTLGKGVSLIADPPRCLDCDFVFRKRTRHTTPGRCPICRSESVSPPKYGIRSDRKKTDHPEMLQ